MISALFADMTLTAAVAAAWLPFLGFLVIFCGLRSRPNLSAGISIGAIAVSLICAVFLLLRYRGLDTPIIFTTRWMASGDMVIPIGFFIDPLSLLMLCVVAGISFLVQIYSLGYMAGDPGFARYYAFMSLFAWAMLNLTLAPTLLQLYIFWELVGVSSYLLIGFWFEKFSASEAGKKAFVMTRLGDIAFFLGLLLVLFHLGNLSIAEIISPAMATRMPPTMITISALLIFGGVIGKSAQFPLLTWLPDAMEGPTPVSALLHSATMVAAGVYLFARLFPFFSLSPTAMVIFLTIGTISLLLASSMAMVSRDIKQVWAYSTISQLGFMIMALASGNYVAGVYHLTTHAGFKALLFLCAGVYIHAFESNDVFDISRHRGRRMLVPTVCITVAAAALAGLPPLSGFFSKELILGGLADLSNPIWLVAGLLGAFLTAYYAFRVIFIILFPLAADAPDEASEHHHSGPNDIWMAGPLIVLALATILLGFAQQAIQFYLVPADTAGETAHHGWLVLTASGLSIGGVLLAWLEFGRLKSSRVGFIERIPALRNLFAERWYIDRFYRFLLDYVVYRGFSNLFTRCDRQVIDGGIDGLSRGMVTGGRIVSYLHAGMIQSKLLVMFIVIIFLGLYFIF